MLQNPPALQIDAYLLVPLLPEKVRQLMGALLDDPGLALHPPGTRDAAMEGAQQAANLALECAAGATTVWGIVARDSQTCVGVAVARRMISGIDLEVMCPSAFTGLGIVETVAEPLAEWLEDHADLKPQFAH